MRITLDTTSPLSDQDIEILGLLMGEKAPWWASPESSAPEPEAAEEPKPTEPAEEPKPTEAAAEPEAEEPEATEEVTKETMDAAVSKAKALIQDGDKAKVRKALESAGLARVGAIETEDQGQKFLQAMGD